MRHKLTLIVFLLLMGGWSPVFAQGTTVTAGLTAASSSCNTPVTSSTPNCILDLLPNNAGAVSVSLSGTWSATVQFEAAGADLVYHALLMTPSSSSTQASSSTGNGLWTINVAGMTAVRVRVSACTSGTVTASINPSLTASMSGTGGGGGGSFTAGGDLSGTSSSQTVIGINGTLLSGLNTGLLKITTGTGAASTGTSSDVIGLFSGTCNSSTFLSGGGACSGAASSVPWSGITNPSGNLSLTMGTNTTAFNTTTAVASAFTWNNTTAALVGASQTSPSVGVFGTEWHGGASVTGGILFQFTPGTGTDAASTFSIAHSGSATGTVTTTFPGPMQAGSSSNAGQIVLPGNTANPSIPSNTASWLGPASASFTAYGLQLPSTGPSGTQALECATPSSSISACSFASVAGSSLDQITGSAAQATGTETATGHEYTFAGVETANLTAPIVIQDTNSTNSNTSMGLIANCAGTDIGCIGLVSNTASGTAAGGGDIFRGYAGSTVTTGVLSGGTLEAKITAAGEGQFGASAPNPTLGTGGGAACTEGSAPTAASTQDQIYCDSTDHTILASQNGASGGTGDSGGATFFPMQINVVSQYTSSVTLAVTDYFVECNKASAITLTLPVTGIAVGKTYVIKQIGAGACTINATSGNIDGQTSFVVSQLYTSMSFVWDGTQWYVI